MKNKKNAARFEAVAGIIAAVYVLLSLVSAMFGLASGVIQVRVSEALCILPLFTPAAVPGLAIGCFTANLVLGGEILDAVFGSLATLLGSLAVLLLKKISRKYPFVRFISPLPNIVFNTLIIPYVLRFVYNNTDAMWYFVITVGLGEIISSAVLGIPLMIALEKRSDKLF